MESRISARDLFDAIYGLRTFLVHYEDALVQASLALLTRNHMFVVGPSGQGKHVSVFAVGAFRRRGHLSAPAFRLHHPGPPHRSTDSVPLPPGRQADLLHRRRDLRLPACSHGRMAGCRVALARALNTILLERKFITKDAIYDCRLHTAFMTGNHVPQGEQWEAVKSRELFFFHAPQLKNIAGRFSAMETADWRKTGKYAHAGIPFNQVEALCQDVEQVRLSPGVHARSRMVHRAL